MLKNNNQTTNVDSFVGTTHKLLKSIEDEQMGEIKINGVVWNVVSKNGKTIEKDSKIKILDIQGNKFIVEEEKQNV